MSPHHLMTQGEIKRCPCSMSSVVRPRNSTYLSGLEQKATPLVDFCSKEGYQESPGNVTPSDYHLCWAREMHSRQEEARRSALDAPRRQRGQTRRTPMWPTSPRRRAQTHDPLSPCTCRRVAAIAIVIGYSMNNSFRWPRGRCGG